MDNISYDKAVANAAALKALGQTRVYLCGDTAFPWAIATECKPGGSHRLDMDTSARFSGVDPCGIEFSWVFDIESRDANGKGYYEIQVAACEAVLRQLRGEARKQFRAYLADCALKVRAQGNKYQDAADRQFREAAILRDLVNTGADNG